LDFNLTKKPDLVGIAMEFFPIQLHSKSGFIFYNNYDSGIYYSTSGYKNPLQKSYCNIALASEVFIELSILLHFL
jgi:hypothetical protein